MEAGKSLVDGLEGLRDAVNEPLEGARQDGLGGVAGVTSLRSSVVFEWIFIYFHGFSMHFHEEALVLRLFRASFDASQCCLGRFWARSILERSCQKSSL